LNSGGQGDCGYLKSTYGNAWRFEQPNTLAYNDKGWSTYIQYNNLPKSLGGGWGAGGGGGGGGGGGVTAVVTSGQVAGGNRPAGCVGQGDVCCYKWGSKYNT